MAENEKKRKSIHDRPTSCLYSARNRYERARLSEMGGAEKKCRSPKPITKSAVQRKF